MVWVNIFCSEYRIWMIAGKISKVPVFCQQKGFNPMRLTCDILPAQPPTDVGRRLFFLERKNQRTLNRPAALSGLMPAKRVHPNAADL